MQRALLAPLAVDTVARRAWYGYKVSWCRHRQHGSKGLEGGRTTYTATTCTLTPTANKHSK